MSDVFVEVLGFQQFWPVGEDIEINWYRSARVELPMRRITPGEKRRIDKRLQRCAFERGGGIVRRAVERGSKFPALRQGYARVDLDPARIVARRVEHHRRPLQHQKVGADLGAAS